MAKLAVVLIDGGYIRALNKNEFGMKRIDFLKFSDELCGDCDRFRTYYYTCPPYKETPPTLKQKQLQSSHDRFIHRLNTFDRFEIRQGLLRKSGTRTYEQKGVDVLFACDLVRLAASHKIDKAITVAGDSDFAPAVKIAKEEMIITELIYWPTSCAPVLFNACDERTRLTKDLIEKVSY